MSPARAYQLLDQAAVTAAITGKVSTIVDTQNVPTESQARPLAALKAEPELVRADRGRRHVGLDLRRGSQSSGDANAYHSSIGRASALARNCSCIEFT